MHTTLPRRIFWAFGRSLRASALKRTGQLPDEARLTPEKAFGVKGLRKFEQREIQVVAHLVEERAQEGTKRDDVLVLRGSHPYLYERPFSVFPGIKAVKLAGPVGWAHAAHSDGYGRNAQILRDPRAQGMSRSFDITALSGCERTA